MPKYLVSAVFGLGWVFGFLAALVLYCWEG